MMNKKGFTMVELLVVLVIVAILAAVATPIYLANVQRSRASEAVSSMALIRQALRDYQINADTYFDVASDEIQLKPPFVGDITPATGALANPAGLDIDAGVARYFSNAAYTVDAVPTDTDGTSGEFTAPPVVNFLISANGAATGTVPVATTNPQCTTTITENCATNQAEVEDYRLEMDNSGRTYVSYDAGTTWQPY